MIQSMVKKRLKARKGFLVSTHTYKRGNNFKLLIFFQCEQPTRCVSFCTDLNIASCVSGNRWSRKSCDLMQIQASQVKLKQRNDNPVSVTLPMDDDLMKTKAKEKAQGSDLIDSPFRGAVFRGSWRRHVEGLRFPF